MSADGSDTVGFEVNSGLKKHMTGVPKHTTADRALLSGISKNREKGAADVVKQGDGESNPTPKKRRKKKKEVKKPAFIQPGKMMDHTSLDFTAMVEYFSMIVYGRRRIGKSVLVKHILGQLKDRFEEAYLYSGTNYLQPMMWGCIHRTCRRQGFDEEHLTGLMEKAESDIQEVLEEFKRVTGKSADEQLNASEMKLFEKMKREKVKPKLILLDDVVHLNAIQTSSVLQALFTLGRHYHMYVILLSQNINRGGSTKRGSRANVDYVATSSVNSSNDMEVLAEDYYGVTGKKDGMRILKAITESENRVFAIADLTMANRRLPEDYITAFKAPPPRKDGKDYFTIGRIFEDEKEAVKKRKRAAESGPSAEKTREAFAESGKGFHEAVRLTGRDTSMDSVQDMFMGTLTGNKRSRVDRRPYIPYV